MPYCDLEICGEGLTCEPQSQLIPDLPGVCVPDCDPVQCFVDPCEVAKCPAYPGAECVPNYCGGCSADFFVNGELVDCSASVGCFVDGVEYSPGESFPGTGDNWCNTCSCEADGTVTCTKIGCGPNPCVTTGCSGEICAPMELFSPCVIEPWMGCMSAFGSCGPYGKDGQCAWYQTAPLQQCLEESGF